MEGLSVYHIEGSFVITNNSKFSVNFERISIGESEFSGGVILPNGKLTLMHEFASEVELNLINDYGASKQIKLSTNKRKE
ncbi:hypothetical protein JCM19233_5522 [Vibrio astriarenae]|nr:hypothetical protein JCM19233_5522 [Vibrio sp. C7]